MKTGALSPLVSQIIFWVVLPALAIGLAKAMVAIDAALDRRAERKGRTHG